MASELRVNTLKDASGNNSVATSFVAGGSAKVWINLNGATAAARDSLNVSSVTDVSGGRNQPNYTTSFSAATYAICISGNGGSGNGTIYQTSDIAVGSFIMDYRYNSSGSTYTTYDPDTGGCGMFGDLA